MTATASPSFWSTAAPYVAALVVLAAAWITHSAKISEFRSTWINELRRDIADYVGAADKWFRKWDELNHLSPDERLVRERDELFPITNGARVILWRIRLRINPRENEHKAEDDALLHNLLELLNPGAIDPRNPEVSWLNLADGAVEQAREILKREWEVTKRFPLLRRWDMISSRFRQGI
jgi:hypothetical protein